MNVANAHDELADAAYAAACAKLPLEDALLIVRAQYEIESQDPDVTEEEANTPIDIEPIHFEDEDSDDD